MADTYTDEEIIEQFHNGRLGNFEMLFQKYHSMVFNMSLRMLGNYQEAEDVTQDIFIKVYEKLDGFRGQSQFKTWLYKIASTTCIDVIRKKKSLWNFINRLIEKRSINEPEKGNDENSWIQEVLNKMPPNQRLLLVMRYIQGFSNKEIAEIQNTTEGTIKVQIFRAREVFKKNSEQYLKEGVFDGM